MKEGYETKAKTQITNYNLSHKRITTTCICAPSIHRDLITKKLLCLPDIKPLVFSFSLGFLSIVKVFHINIVISHLQKYEIKSILTKKNSTIIMSTLKFAKFCNAYLTILSKECLGRAEL